MADPAIALDSELTSVQLGAQARVTVTVGNTGTVVDGYRLQLLGPAATWARVEPSEVSVYPQQQATASIVFQPPVGANAVDGGRHGFGILAQSTLNPRESAVAEGIVDVARVVSVQALVAPVTSAGPWHARHRVQLSNAGNTAAQLTVTASDPDETLGFAITPATVTLPPGGQAQVDVRVMAKKAILWRTASRRPFRVSGITADGSPGFSIDAAFNQRPSGWMAVGLAAVALLAVFTLLAPSIIGWWVTNHPQAATTPSLAPRGAPPKPKVTVTPKDHASVQVRWNLLEGAETYWLQQVEPDGTVSAEPEKLSGTRNSANVSDLNPTNRERKVCFRVWVIRGGVRSPDSDIVCAQLKAAPPAPSTPPTPPAVEQKPPVRAYWVADSAMAIDGSYADWELREGSPVDTPVEATPRTSTTGTAYLRWNEDYLYLLVTVKDPTARFPTDPKTLWKGDAVILELGQQRATDPNVKARMNDAYYMFGRSGSGSPALGVLDPSPTGDSFDNLRSPTPPIDSRLGQRPDGQAGYVLEARIPRTVTGQDTFQSGIDLAFNVVISDYVSPTRRAMVANNTQRYAGWRGRTAYWRDLQLYK